MFRIKTAHVLVLLGVIAPVCGYSADYCIKVNGGFGASLGTSFIGTGFTVPADGTCAPWSGFTKTASTVILTTYGVGCTSTNGKVLTLSLSSADPGFIEAGSIVSDYIVLCAQGYNTCVTGGDVQEDQGNFSGPAAQQTCTATLLKLPPSHD